MLLSEARGPTPPHPAALWQALPSASESPSANGEGPQRLSVIHKCP